MALYPLIPEKNELGDPPGRVNELGDALPPLEDSPQLASGLKPLMGNAAREATLQQQLMPKANAPPQGFWQNVRHVAARIGNIAGDIAAPGVTAMIPGSDLNKGLVHDAQSKELAGLQAEDRADVTTGADVGLKQAQTAGAEQEQRLKPSMDTADIALKNAQAASLLHPQAKTDFEAWQVQNPGKPIEDWLQAQANAKPSNEAHVPMLNDAGLPVFGNYNAKTGVYTDVQGQVIKNPKPIPAPVPVAGMVFNPQPGGGYQTQAVKPGMNIKPGALTEAGMNSENVPTAATRTMAETAPKVIELATRSEQLIDEQINSLGPAASRWSEFMAGKVGAPNPEFTKLRTDIGLLQTSLMRMHVGARGGEQIMEHFRDLIDASKQDPQNLKAALDEIKAYAAEVGKSGGQGVATETDKAAGTGSGAPPPGAKIIKWSDVK